MDESISARERSYHVIRIYSHGLKVTYMIG